MYPFSSREYRDLFVRHFGPALVSYDGNFELLGDTAVLIGMKPVLNGQEVTDFGELATDTNTDEVHSSLKKQGIVTIQYDYVREDSKLYTSLLGQTADQPTYQETSPYIMLPATWDAYLESLDRTDRKELKRKFKRLDTAPHAFSVLDTVTDADFDTFIRLHRLSDTAKERFMSEPMRLFFKDVLALTIPGWKTKLATLSLTGVVAASVFFFENDERVLLYNSGFDPQYKFYSTGLLLKAWLVRYAIESGKKVFDFLRGNERYKYDLGSTDMKLYRFRQSV